MTLKDWLAKNEISNKTAAKHFGCSIYAIRKWLRGERIPRPKMQNTIKRVTGGAVTGDDWIASL